MGTPGVLHEYTKKLVAFEHTSPNNNTNQSPHTLLWVGGLGDGLLTVKYTKAITSRLPPDWSLAEVMLSSAYKGFGNSSLRKDAKELAQCVKHFRELRPDQKIVIMGHSTGCQDIMEYLVGDDETDFQRPHIDGAILQGGLSDREAFSDLMAKEGPDTKENYDMIIALAKEMVDEGRGLEMMARTDNPVADLFGAPMTAYRTHSLLSVGGDDDYFSSDLPDSRLAATFGNIPRDTPIMFLLGAADPYIPDTVDRVALVRRWTDAVRAGGGFVDDLNGGVPPEMTHNLNDEGAENAIQDLVQRVVGFLHRVDSELVQGSARLYSL